MIDNNNSIHFLSNIILSVDSSELYYGRKENLNNQKNRILVCGYVPKDAIVAGGYANDINDLYYYVSTKEVDSKKKKARLFYIDRGFFINNDFKWSNNIQ